MSKSNYKDIIKSIELENFKCYQNESFDLNNLTVFCGNNSVGKSTVIQALLLLFQNEFSNFLYLDGDFVELGSYNDVKNINADSDSIFITVKINRCSCSWGHDDQQFSKIELDKRPTPALPLGYHDVLFGDFNSFSSSLNEKYSDNFIFLCAERWGPRNNYPYSHKRRSRHWLGIHGEYSAQVLSYLVEQPELLRENDPRIHQESPSRQIFDNFISWMHEISPGAFVKADSIPHANISTNQFVFQGHTYKAVNVGFGLSYALPVVLALLQAKPGGLVIIENPEAHLHPKGQSYMGRLISLTAQAGVQVIVETHSDHVINGLRLMPRLGFVESKNITIYQINSDDSTEEKVQKITVNEQGELSEWPKDFFDQQLIDMDVLMSGEEQ